MKVISVEFTMTKVDFSVVCNYFEARYRSMARTGEVPYRLTAHGAWACSRMNEIHHFFKALAIERYRCLIDLGSGDGSVVCVAGLFTRAVGIEIDPELCRMAVQAARDLGMEGRASFIRSNFTTQRIQSADCLYLYPDKPIYGIEALLAGWSGDLLVYGPHFPAARMTATRRLESGAERLIVYRN